MPAFSSNRDRVSPIPSTRLPGLWLLILATLLGSTTGCSTLGYYNHSIQGHLSLLSQRQPIEELLKEEELPQERRKQLTTAIQIREYAIRRLSLPDNGSYRSFVELDRPYVVWSVVATPEFSLQPAQWCFPVIGCVAYRGYYNEELASAFAYELKNQGYDVHVGGVAAYSTLGWTDSPLLSSMVNRGEFSLANVVFHELAHELLYIPNDTAFNEAFATVVGEYGTKQWLKDTNPSALEYYEHWLDQEAQFVALLREIADRLNELYAKELPAVEMRRQKQSILDNMHEDYKHLKAQWGGYSGFDAWFDQPVNNARLVSLALYRDLAPDFGRWLQACGYDIDRFYEVAHSISELPKAERHEKLRSRAQCASKWTWISLK